MNNYQCIIAKAEFIQSPIFRRPLTLDGLSAGLLYEYYRCEGEDHISAIAHAHATIPLKRIHDTYAGSSAIVPNCSKTTHTFIQSFYSHLNQWSEPGEKIAKIPKKRQNSSDYPPIPTPEMNRYQTSNLAEDNLPIYFLGQGNIDIVRKLLDSVTHLGKKRTSGYGELRKKMEVYEVEGYEYFGIVSRAGRLLRPITEKAAELFQPKIFKKAFESVKPPYWESEKVVCCVPDTNMSNDTIMDIVEDTE